jgi:hypothetical protein
MLTQFPPDSHSQNLPTQFPPDSFPDNRFPLPSQNENETRTKNQLRFSRSRPRQSLATCHHLNLDMHRIRGSFHSMMMFLSPLLNDRSSNSFFDLLHHHRHQRGRSLGSRKQQLEFKTKLNYEHHTILPKLFDCRHCCGQTGTSLNFISVDLHRSISLLMSLQGFVLTRNIYFHYDSIS